MPSRYMGCFVSPFAKPFLYCCTGIFYALLVYKSIEILFFIIGYCFSQKQKPRPLFFCAHFRMHPNHLHS